jgi:hypothetical protein
MNELTDAGAREALARVATALYPGGDPDAAWSPDALDEVAAALAAAGLVPASQPALAPQQGADVTNRKLLTASEALLNELDRQRLFLLRVGGTPMPCPACKGPVNFFDATGIDIDAYDFGATGRACGCPACGARLGQVVPLLPGVGHRWHWQLEECWLREQLDKARQADRRDAPGEGNTSP